MLLGRSEHLFFSCAGFLEASDMKQDAGLNESLFDFTLLSLLTLKNLRFNRFCMLVKCNSIFIQTSITFVGVNL